MSEENVAVVRRHWRIEVEEIRDAGDDKVFAATRAQARGRGSGAPADQMIYSAVSIRDGRIVRFEDHTERDEALAAVGLA
jgi:ketosteroid isomerase-like protein